MIHLNYQFAKIEFNVATTHYLKYAHYMTVGPLQGIRFFIFCSICITFPLIIIVVS